MLTHTASRVEVLGRMVQARLELRSDSLHTERSRLRAPVDGTVQQLAVHTVGGVVRTAEPLMVVVPHGVALEVEANVLNRDIGFVEGGDERRDDREEQESRARAGGYAELDRPPQSLDDTSPRRQSNGTRILSPPAHPEPGSRPEPHVHLRLEGVGKRFGSVVALDGVDLDVRHGEFFCLLGASAAGKTTTLRVISGLEAPDGGRVVFDGEDVAGIPSPERGIAMVFQNFALYPHLTVFENLAYPLREARVPGTEIKARVGEMAEMLRIGHVLERKPETASGGEQQRIAIGRALIRRPRLLLLDEPLTNLDAKLRHDMRAEFKRLHRELGTTMLYATPDELEALGMGERLGVLRDGRIVQTGSPDELYEHPMNTYVGQMVGSPKMNLAPAERGDGASVATSFTDLSGGPWAAPLADLPPGAELLLGFRPNDIRPAAGEPRGPRFPARVHLTEPLGDVTVLDLDIAEHMFRMVLPESEAVRYRAGDRLDVELAVECTHLFARDTGAALRRDPAAPVTTGYS